MRHTPKPTSLLSWRILGIVSRCSVWSFVVESGVAASPRARDHLQLRVKDLPHPRSLVGEEERLP
jgi:hypothetical protein